MKLIFKIDENNSRNTQNSLNKLGEIFDKDSIEERQELAGLFGELAYKAVGDLALKNGWEEGSAEKNALHALIGGIMSELGGSDFLAGASGAMVNEMIQDKLGDMFEDDPAMHQWASALIGGVVSEIVGGNAQAGASTAASGTKNNYLTHKQYLDYQKELADCNGDEEQEKAVKEKYKKICDEQTLAGSLGEAEGEGFEWGVDLDDDGNVKGFTISENINSFGAKKENEIAKEILSVVDTSTWENNELRTYTIGTGIGVSKVISANAEIGYAVDKQGNIYKVCIGSISAGANLTDITPSNILSAINKISYSVTAQYISGKALSKEDLRDAYSGLSIGVSKTSMGIQVGYSLGESSATVGIGGTNSVMQMQGIITYLIPVD